MSTETATPTDVPETPVAKKRRQPRRFRLFDDGQGDYRFYEAATGEGGLPRGTLTPIPEIGGFQSAIDAKAAIRKHGHLLVGKQIMLIRGVEMLKIELETQPQVKITAKEKTQVSGPKKEEAPAETASA
jgi:hypothetical protein